MFGSLDNTRLYEVFGAKETHFKNSKHGEQQRTDADKHVYIKGRERYWKCDALYD